MAEELPPIFRTFEVRCSVEHAFDTWTGRINLWWPLAAHSVSRENAASVTVEPRRGGRIFETTREGREIPWYWTEPYNAAVKKVAKSGGAVVTIATSPNLP